MQFLVPIWELVKCKLSRGRFRKEGAQCCRKIREVPCAWKQLADGSFLGEEGLEYPWDQPVFHLPAVRGPIFSILRGAFFIVAVGALHQ
jgi:hypothetical protein